MSTSAPFPSPTKIWHNTSYPAIDAKKPSLSAAGKNVVITGGGAGIGFRVARSFAEAGASSIAILGRTEQTLLDTKAAVEKDFPAVNIFTYVADITKKKEVDEAFSAYVAKVGELHVLVNNAGNGKVGPSVKDADVDEWMYTLEVNVKGSLLVAQAFLRSAVSDAVLINMTSLLSYLPVPAFSAYVASKCASVSLFDTLQLENPNVRVANLHPGIVDTAMTRGAGGTPMDDVSLPGNFTVWLASSEATFTKGKYLWVNWDVEELMAKSKEIESSALFTMTLSGWPFEKKLEDLDEALFKKFSLV